MIREGRRPRVVGTMLRDAVGQKGATLAHRVELAVVTAQKCGVVPRLYAPSDVTGR
jgi:hypothetical protein